MRRKLAFRTNVWDPLLIIPQIIALQALYYTSISVIVLFTLLITGNDITLDHLLDYREFRGDTVLGWTLGFAWISNSVVGIYLLLRVVQRAKLVLDFTVTLHFFHLIITSYYSGHIPTTFVWWAINVTTCCIMIFGGELYCMRKEMEPIMLGGGSGGDGEGVTNGGGGGGGSTAQIKNKKSAEVDRDRYEMVPMEEIEVGG
ncbi:550_t:CDS:2 [Ambispora leptoticha]|uniref:550_t:CDS:1 n=1 Tax=Ambispora leptoticha TaxID=144679 RepID=A0A9N9DMV3_9GLOM|nr:550_t:CDS:2 [Ambispora leptoticha]